MNKRALVIGSRLPPLLGTENDADAMERLLIARGFMVDKRTGAAASRQGILDGYERLIRDVDRDGAAVFYYAGHGGYAANPNAGLGQRARVQCLFPTDWTDTGEFRAILDVELSVLLARLTEKTHNATVILDCCHSAEMSRGPYDRAAAAPLIPRVYGAAWARLVPEFLARHPVDLTRVDVESNPHAVRLVATAPDRQAFETTIESGGAPLYRGLFTLTLERVLAESGGAALSWQTLVNRVRELVIERSWRQQLPAAEGPADRLPFTTQAMKRPDAVVLFYDHGEPYLRANRILGAAKGATYDIMPLGAADHDRSAVIARANVVELVGGNARVALEPVEGAPAPEPGALGFPTSLPYPPLPVRITGATAARIDQLVHARSGDNRPGRIDRIQDEGQARFEVIADGARLTLLDAGIPAGTPLDDTDDGRELLIRRLERWSKAEAVRSLTTEGLPRDAIEVDWGRVEQGRTMGSDPGTRMHVGDWIYVTVKNRTDRTLHVAIFDIGVAGKVTLLTAASPTGRRLEPDKSFTLGQRDGERLVRGLGPVIWPDDVPTDALRRESFLVIAASAWTDFKRLETEALVTRSTTNRLEAILDGFRRGITRDLSEEPAELDGFCVHRIDFDLSAKPRSAAGDQPPAA